MKARLAVYVNSDDALLLWTVDKLDDGCTGFAVQRRRVVNGKAGPPEFIPNWAPAGPQAHRTGTFASSDAWPFRCFTWTDHSVDPGDNVSYRVIPVIPGAPALREDMASDWSKPRLVGLPKDATHQPFFNRGFVISQFMSRYLDEHYPGLDRDKALKKFKADIGKQLESQVRVFLSGQVRTTLLGLLDDLQASGGQLYAALFELNDDELLSRLVKLRGRAHIVLSNGSIDARTQDENKLARTALLKAKVDVEEKHRFIAPKPLGHNKFAVFTDAAGNPTAVWTGSTNWTTTGLCTQLNNALLIKDPAIAKLYREQWQALRSAHSDHPPELARANSKPSPAGSTSVHFTRAQKRVDLKVLRDIVMGANEGVLFLMFVPGASGVLGDVMDLAKAKPKLLVRGVVSTLPEGRKDEKTGKSTKLRVSVVGGATSGSARPHTFDVVQPEGLTHPAAGWAVETTRQQFAHDIGFAIIHSKVLVVDPFSDDPTVVTGSHNFSISASEDNDENFVVVRGDKALAEAYAVNVESAWRHYAGRMGNPHPRLQGPKYLNALLSDQRRQESFWHL